jgi:hypothetical protein
LSICTSASNFDNFKSINIWRDPILSISEYSKLNIYVKEKITIPLTLRDSNFWGIVFDYHAPIIQGKTNNANRGIKNHFELGNVMPFMRKSTASVSMPQHYISHFSLFFFPLRKKSGSLICRYQEEVKWRWTNSDRSKSHLYIDSSCWARLTITINAGLLKSNCKSCETWNRARTGIPSWSKEEAE